MSVKQTDAAAHVVKIFKTRVKAKASPGNLALMPGDRVMFKAINTRATVFFPNKTLFDVVTAPETDYLVVEVKPKDPNPKIFEVSMNAKGEFPYAIYCRKVNDFVEVNSSPTMIVEEED